MTPAHVSRPVLGARPWRTVIQATDAGVRVLRVPSWHVAQVVRAAWERNDYRWPGEVRPLSTNGEVHAGP